MSHRMDISFLWKLVCLSSFRHPAHVVIFLWRKWRKWWADG